MPSGRERHRLHLRLHGVRWGGREGRRPGEKLPPQVMCTQVIWLILMIIYGHMMSASCCQRSWKMCETLVPMVTTLAALGRGLNASTFEHMSV